MAMYARSRLRALPIHNPRDFSLRSTIAILVNISELSPLDIRTTKAALDKLSDVELEKYTEPEELTSASEAGAHVANRRAQSSEHLWKRQDSYLFLLSRSRFAKRRRVPGVVFELMIRTGVSTWTVYQIPDSVSVFKRAVYLERNELMAYSHRPPKLPICPKQKFSHDRLYRLGRAVCRIAATLFA